LSNPVGNTDTKTLSAAWSRFETASIIGINAIHRRVVFFAPRARRVISSMPAYLIGIPLMLAIPAAGVFLGLRLAHTPRFANHALVDSVVNAAFFLLTAFFAAVRWFGLLGAIAIAGFVVLAIFFLCARLVGANVLAIFRRQPKPSVFFDHDAARGED
jgi:hypothetical protein